MVYCYRKHPGNVIYNISTTLDDHLMGKLHVGYARLKVIFLSFSLLVSPLVLYFKLYKS